ncbi:SNF2 family helicase, putative [Trichophyton benhamiae CBS 112371]|uniref:SNF2 family helicase, putative n=1 Tax=Arthroderma benhamiae (strain ATCC MYA-4681 / CBS 112371) TaxID=663331 RepID=D4AL49_ARTBC|nr:SNF2 family helicase, putative [Trichophyton benhamiae CBS 112371]EFE36108.1 SNF2 family helicase, putative [Trichophyton benhamiae CBS 112371]
MDIAEGGSSPRETDASNSISSVSNSSIPSPRTSDTDIESLLDASIDFPSREKCLESPPNVREDVSEEVRSLLVSVPPEILRGKYTILPGERPKPGLDRSLPPICKIEDIFEDLTAQALENGFDSFLKHIGSRELRVATMCSGTESPLLALEMIQSSLRQLTGKTFRLHHLFSAEIDAFKQSYIQRNFSPEIIFRDVNELVAEEATTAFGSVKKVPTDPDLLVVGFSCVDFSALNFYRKTLEEMGESGHTFYGVIRYMQRCRPALVVLENVCSAPWEQIKTILQEIDYKGYHMKIDSKNYYLPQTRERGYMICIDQRRLVTEPVGEAKSKKLSAFAQLMKKLERPASSPVTQFLLSHDDIRLQDAVNDISANSNKERQAVDWTRYKARHLGYRMREGLGDKRPLTKWQENGTCQMPDFYWHGWSRTQTERVWDTLDVNFLRTVARGYDINSKSRVIDLSQGLDRELDQRASGVAGCLTPRGQHFITSRGGPLLGIEALALQGIPIDRLLIGNDGQRDLHDLAGNAMTSTVVGAAIITALTLGYQALALPTAPCDIDNSILIAQQRSIAPNHTMVPLLANIADDNGILTGELYQLSLRTARLCYCDGHTGTRSDIILICVACGHTACSKCGKNPPHCYRPVETDELKLRLPPIEFETQVKTRLPMCLQISGLSVDMFQDLRESDMPPDVNNAWDTFINTIEHSLSDVLKFQGVMRHSGWTITYEGTNSFLKLTCTSIGLQWLLYVIPSKSEPSNSPLRQMLSRPIAKMTPSGSSLFDGTWLIGSPISSQFDLLVAGGGDLVDSLPARSGLQHPSFRNLKTWSILHIDAKTEEMRNLEIDIRGAYELLPDCGAASGSLRKRLNSSGSPVYLFLDPTEIGPHQLDSWVFSLEHERLGFGQARNTIAEIRPNWSPLYLSHDQVTVPCWYRKWRESASVALSVYQISPPPQFSIPGPSEVLASFSCACDGSYSTILQCSVPADLSDLEVVPGMVKKENLLESASMLKKFGWVLQRAIGITQFENWETVQISFPDFKLNCSTCAPEKPRLAWALDEKDRVYAYENPEDAASFERSIKSRPAPFLGFTTLDESSILHLQICLNVLSLLHRAAGNLGVKDNVTLQWRLCIDTTGFIPRRLFKLLEKNNKLDTPHTQPPNFRRHYLRPEQLRSLQWMCNQESDHTRIFVEEEVVEALLPIINWRAEGKASTEKMVLGGILGDEVGYGKTAISLGLIDVQYEKDGATIPASVNGRIPIKATMVLVPGHLFDQWKREIHKFLGNTYRILEVKTNSSHGSTTIRDFEEADIVLVSTSVLKGTAYYTMMECFAAAPEVPKGEGRIFVEWLHDAIGSLSDQVDRLLTSGALSVLKNIEDRKEELRQGNGLSKYKPSKRLKGQKFQEHLQKMRQAAGITDLHETAGKDTAGGNVDSIDSAVELGKRKRDASPVCQVMEIQQESKKPKKAAQTRKDGGNISVEIFHLCQSSTDWRNVRSPLLHMFEFNRVIIDEFTYSKDRNYAAALAISSRKKWILSGTPPLNNFADVKSFSPFLGINLGIDEDDGRKVENERLRTIQRERTVTRRSTVWHERRHQVAQGFLDQFMRKNIPDIDDIPWTEHIIGVSLSAAERAVYLELFMQLMSQNLRLRKHGRGLYDSEEIARLDEIIGNSSSPEEALCKRCSLFVYNDPTSSTDAALLEETDEMKLVDDNPLIHTRRKQISSLAADIMSRVRRGLWLRGQLDEGTTHFDRLLESIEQDRFGDLLVTAGIKMLLKRAKAIFDPNDGSMFYLAALEKKKNPDDPRPEFPKNQTELISDLNYCTDSLRRLVYETIAHTRALRLYHAVRCFQDPPPSSKFICYSCSSEREDPRSLSILGECGHSTCESCIERCQLHERCLLEGCSGTVHEYRIIKWTDLCHSERHTPTDKLAKYGSSKFTAVIDLLEDTEKVPADDQVLLFIQFPELMDAASKALQSVSIPHTVIQPGDRTPTSKISEFQNGKESVKSKVLILNLGDVTASGLNLQNANHIIFFGPLVSRSQYDYDSGMAQAIGRSRRYGQLKHVHIYHVLALRTVEVNIFEQRRKQYLAKRGDHFITVQKSEIKETDEVDWKGFPLEGSNAESYQDDFDDK